MDKRQVFFINRLKSGKSLRPFRFLIIAILTWISACVPLTPVLPTPTPTSAAPPPLTVPTSTPILAKPSPTPKKCSETRGQVQSHAFDSVVLPNFHIYLPPCYDFDSASHYPVLYLLHGANFEDDQWIRLGIEDQIPAYIIVMPYEKYSLRAIDEAEFGEVFIEEFISYIDENFRTLTDEKYRAVGGLSRGGGWAIHYGLTHWRIFGRFGAHSPAIFYQDYAKLDNWLEKIPANALPKIYIDAGDKDQDYLKIITFANLLDKKGISHKLRLYIGLHNENYWRAHVAEYLRWYGEEW